MSVQHYRNISKSRKLRYNLVVLVICTVLELRASNLVHSPLLRLANRLWNGTANFPHFTDSSTARIGGFQLEGSPTTDWKKILPAMREMILLSVTEFGMARDTLNERRRPEVRSIVSSYDPENCGLSEGSSWCALLPDRRRLTTTLFSETRIHHFEVGTSEHDSVHGAALSQDA